MKAARRDLVRDVVRLGEERIMRMRNLGKITADEIARKLQQNKICNTVWDGYVLSR